MLCVCRWMAKTGALNRRGDPVLKAATDVPVPPVYFSLQVIPAPATYLRLDGYTDDYTPTGLVDKQYIKEIRFKVFNSYNSLTCSSDPDACPWRVQFDPSGPLKADDVFVNSRGMCICATCVCSVNLLVLSMYTTIIY